ncbi:carbohydrate kinase [candidate division KSB1 bacterium]|nr:carbohydrate kinase [candidate division KSB1 bacterium]
MHTRSKKNFLVGIGEVLWDIYQDQRHLGGAPANVVMNAHQLGLHGVLVSRVGDDGMGKELVRTLTQRGLATDYVQLDRKKGTGTVLVSLDIKGVPSFRCSHDVAFDYLAYNAKLKELAPQADAVVFGTLAQRSKVARQTILDFLQSATKAIKILDVNARASEAHLQVLIPASLEQADVVKLSKEEVGLIARVLRREGGSIAHFAEYLIKQYQLQLVAITYGAEGCELFNAHESCRLPALPIQVTDTTGAGDAFTAGMVYQLLHKASLREIAEFANLVASFLCTQRGATPHYDVHTLAAFRQSYAA